MPTTPTHLRTEFCNKIESAFDGVPFPGAEHKSLSQAEAWDTYRQCDQSQDFKGKWKDLPARDFKQNQSALSHLDAHGFLYYLPALMCAILKKDDVGELLRESLLDGLRNERFKSQTTLMTEQQLSVVSEFIRLCNSDEELKLD